MFSGIPLPKVVADVGPGGGIVTGMMGANALQHAQQENQYYPQSQQANINALNAQAQYHQNEANKINWLMKNPQYMSPEGWLYSGGANSNNGSQQSSNANMGSGNTISQGNNPNGQQSNGSSSYINDDKNQDNLAYLKMHPIAAAVATQQATSNVDLGNKLISDASDSGLQANNVQQATERMQEAYPKLKWDEKGPVFGRTPIAFSTAAGDFDSAHAALNGYYAKALQSGHITNQDYQVYKDLSAGRYSPQQSFNDISNYNLAMSKRMQEKGAFYAAAKKSGIPPQLYQPLYVKYMQERPVYDTANLKPIPDNLNSFKDYLNNDAVNATLNGDPYKPREHNDEQNNQSQSNAKQSSKPNSVKQAIKEQGDNFKSTLIKVISPNGKTGTIPQEDMQLALSQGYRRVS